MKKLCALGLALGLVLSLGCAQAQQERQAQLMRVAPKKWTQAMLKEAFLAGEQVEMAEKNGYIEYERPHKEITAGYIASTDQYQYTLSIQAGSLLSYQSDRLSLEDGLALYAFDDSGESAGGELDSFPISQALQAVGQMCQALGIEEGEVIGYSACDALLLQQLRDRRTQDIANSIKWAQNPEASLILRKESNECFALLPLPEEGYLIRLAVNYAGVPCQSPLLGSDNFAGGSFNPVYILSYVTPSGVDYFEVNDQLYDILETKPAGANSSLSQEQAAAKAGADLSGCRAAYEYVPVRGKNKTILLQPAWCFYPEDGSYPIRVNAFNGKVLK